MYCFIWWTHFCINITKDYFLDLHIFTYTNRFILKRRSKKKFFVFGSCLSRYCRFKYFFPKKNYVELSLESTLEIKWPIVGKLLVGRFQIYILLCVKNFSFLRVFVRDSYHIDYFREEIPELTFAWILPKFFFFDLYVFTYTNQLLSKCRSKRIFFPLFLVQILPFQTFFFRKRFIFKFFCRQLCPSCDLLLESSWGVNPKYIYFYGPKIFPFSFKESYHIHCYGEKNTWTHFRMSITKKCFLDLHVFTYTNWFLLNCTTKNLFFTVFSMSASPDIAVSAGFFPKKIYI